MSYWADGGAGRWDYVQCEWEDFLSYLEQKGNKDEMIDFYLQETGLESLDEKDDVQYSKFLDWAFEYWVENIKG